MSEQVRIERRSSLSPDEVEQVRRLVTDATDADGVGPLSEQARLDLSHPGRHVLGIQGGRVVAYAGGPDASLELVVAPAARSQGLGGRLLDTVLPPEGSPAAVWSHGDLPAARALLRSRSLTPTRDLRRLGRSLTRTPAERAPVEIPASFAVRGFREGDEDAVLAVNARAFVHHAEQGSLDRAGFRERAASAWFEPEGLILVEDVSGAAPRLAAFHWTKADPADGDPEAGEVYVVAVDPAYQGRRLGSLVTRLGLDHLRGRGLTRVVLYVEADNEAAMATYAHQGFQTLDRDVQWSRHGDPR